MKKLIGIGIVLMMAVSLVFYLVRRRHARRLASLEAEMSELA